MSGISEWTESPFYSMPKVDLHRHLTGSINVDTAIRIAKAHNAILPSYEPAELDRLLFHPPRVRNLREFFVPWGILDNLFVSLAAVREIVLAVIEAASQDNVIYLEIRTGPRGILGEAPFSFLEFVREVDQAVDDGASRYGIVPRFVLGLPRHTFARVNTIVRDRLFSEVIETIAANHPSCFVGVDLSGDEEQFGADGFVSFFQHAAKAGLGIAVHAGEMGPPSNVRYAVEVLGAKRIGHGLAAAKDPGVLDLLSAAQCAVEVSPTSNFVLSRISRIEDLPLNIFSDWHIPFVICSDNPARCKTSMTQETARVAEAFGLSIEDFKALNKRAIHHAFCSDQTKSELLSRLAEAV